MAHHSPDLVRGIAAGLVAGLAAAAVMEAFQTIAAKPFGRDASDEEPATVKAADAASLAITGALIPEPKREASGRVMHYFTGAVVGSGYGVLTEYYPAASAGFGATYGLATSLVLDEAVVPALGLGDAPWETSAATHAYGAASHLVFGITLEAVRRLIGGRTRD